MKKTLCLICMLFTFMSTYAKKEYIQFFSRGDFVYISGALPAPLQEKIKSKERSKISKKDLEEILGHKIEIEGYEETYIAEFLNYLADFGFELQHAFQRIDGDYSYILVRDTEEKKD